ncbi:beta-lactamase family protein [Arthrobacter gandavensis]|uniref:serine hydrolase domain-containing protein n=1 Tax=Arthrobacter gandavensis TaxID=169960 RepID=UPI00188EC8AC|nr:serine hydrolase domain-containing protein [Arthrobacter gandavensis]MBF4994880.1 beta-lactamase family protein [Arthrobacter gandavensis]
MPGSLQPLWDSLASQVQSGWCPGLVAGVRIGGQTEVRAFGTLDLRGTAPVQPGTPFRIASLSKLIGGALALDQVAEGRLTLDDDISRWLPGLGDLRVLASPDAPLSVTVPARGPVTLRHLLTLTAGFGIDFGETPYSKATRELLWGPNPPDMDPDTYLDRLAQLPLAAQPGQRWMYHSGADLLSVLLSRIAGKPLSQLLAERITGPFGLAGTGFPTGTEEFPAAYQEEDGELVEAVSYRDAFGASPQFESLGGGMVSTVPDYAAFLSALADDVLLPAGTAASMATDQLTSGQRAGFTEMAGPGESWGYMTAVRTKPGASWSEPGMWGWAGGSGTSAAVYPNGDIGVVFTQRFMSGPQDSFDWFWGPFGAARSAARGMPGTAGA